MGEPAPPERIVVIRGHSVRDAAGNSYGIVDLYPAPEDRAVLLGVRSAATGERAQLVLRELDTVERLGLSVQAVHIDIAEPERVTLLVGSSEAA